VKSNTHLLKLNSQVYNSGLITPSSPEFYLTFAMGIIVV